MSERATSRRWDAAAYDRVSDVQQRWAEEVLARLALRGDETVLDAGCGSGRVTRRLLERLPRGRVVAVDASAEMVEHARRALGHRATVVQADLSMLELGERVDAVFSNAVFHWVLDHQRLFASLFRALKPGGVLVAQCGGRGNLAKFLAIVEDIAAQPPFAPHLASFARAWTFASPEDTEARLRTAGFAEARAWLSLSDVTPADPAGFLAAVPLRCHLDLLPSDLHEPFTTAVLQRCGKPLKLDYRRLNIEARRAS